MTISTARIETKHAREYLLGLDVDCRHRRSVATDPSHAHVVLPQGICEFEAGEDFLAVTLIAQSNFESAALEDAVSNTLDRMAVEDLRYHWIMAPDHPVNPAPHRVPFRDLAVETSP